jgi:hypothetical protein
MPMSDARTFRFQKPSRSVAVAVAAALAMVCGSGAFSSAAVAATPNAAPVLTLNSGKVSWPAQSGATDFRAAISTGARGATRATTYQDLGDVSSFTPAQPAVGQTLYYGIASEGSSGEDWSANEVSITGVAKAPAVSVAPTVTVTGGKVSWAAQPGATDFRAAISTGARGSATRTTTYQDLGTASSFTPAAPAAGQTLYYGIASEGPGGELWSNEVSITTAKPMNVAPTLTLSGGKVSWAAQPAATDFRASISTAATGSSTRTTTYQDLGDVRSFTPAAPAAGTTLYYDVASEGPGGEVWSTNEVSIATPMPANVAPTLTVSGGKVSWTAQPGATDFKASISTAARGASTRTSTYLDEGTATSFTPPTPAAGQTMYYGVASEGPAGEIWSAGEVTISGSAVAPVAPAAPVTPVAPVTSSGSMMVGLNSGWGTTSASDMKGTLGLARIDTSEGGTETPSTYHADGIKVIATFPGDVGGGYNTGGVSAINIPNWVSMATSYYANQCMGSTDYCPAIEVLNEPYGSWFWGANAADSQNEAAYANLVKSVYQAFQSKYGTAAPKILAAYDKNSGWWAGMVAAVPNITSYFDGVVVHPYGGTGSAASAALGNHALVTQAHNDTGKPDWITEFGWPTAVGQPSTGDSLQWSQPAQATNIYNFVTWARSTGYVGALTYFNYRDYGTNNWYGLENGAGTKKPGWTALAESAASQACTVCS